MKKSHKIYMIFYILLILLLVGYLTYVQAEEISINFDLPADWSMISLPVAPDNASVSSLFPGAKVVYGYEKGSGYMRIRPEDILKVGKGYWILLDQNQSYSQTGQPIKSYNKIISEDGWDMIGGCSFPANISSENCDIGVIYEYIQGTGYQRVSESEDLEIGNGYWVLLKNRVDKAKMNVNKIGVIVEKLYISSLYPSINDQVFCQCKTYNTDPNEPLTFEWTLNGEILPDNDANIVWTVPDTKGMYTICCTVSDNHGNQDNAFNNIFVVEPELLTFQTDADGEVTFFDENVNDNIKIEAHDLNGNALGNFDIDFLLADDSFDVCVSDPNGEYPTMCYSGSVAELFSNAEPGTIIGKLEDPNTGASITLYSGSSFVSLRQKEGSRGIFGSLFDFIFPDPEISNKVVMEKTIGEPFKSDNIIEVKQFVGCELIDNIMNPVELASEINTMITVAKAAKKIGTLAKSIPGIILEQVCVSLARDIIAYVRDVHPYGIYYQYVYLNALIIVGNKVTDLSGEIIDEDIDEVRDKFKDYFTYRSFEGFIEADDRLITLTDPPLPLINGLRYVNPGSEIEIEATVVPDPYPFRCNPGPISSINFDSYFVGFAEMGDIDSTCSALDWTCNSLCPGSYTWYYGALCSEDVIVDDVSTIQLRSRFYIDWQAPCQGNQIYKVWLEVRPSPDVIFCEQSEQYKIFEMEFFVPGVDTNNAYIHIPGRELKAYAEETINMVLSGHEISEVFSPDELVYQLMIQYDEETGYQPINETPIQGNGNLDVYFAPTKIGCAGKYPVKCVIYYQDCIISEVSDELEIIEVDWELIAEKKYILPGDNVNIHLDPNTEWDFQPDLSDYIFSWTVNGDLIPEYGNEITWTAPEDAIPGDSFLIIANIKDECTDIRTIDNVLITIREVCVSEDIPEVFEGILGVDVVINKMTIGPEYSAWGIDTLALDAINFTPVYGWCAGQMLPNKYKLDHRLSYTVSGPRKNVTLEFELKYPCCTSGEIAPCTQTLVFSYPVVSNHPLFTFLESYQLGTCIGAEQ